RHADAYMPATLTLILLSPMPCMMFRMQAGVAPYKVYDAAGQLVQPSSSALEIDVRDWLAGTYIAI
ncbi:MAG: T9SS type A sorting domain-containing protein, partial [Flavobacteriales bacterium]